MKGKIYLDKIEPFCSHLQSLMKKKCSILKGHNSFRTMSQKEVDSLYIEQDEHEIHVAHS